MSTPGDHLPAPPQRPTAGPPPAPSRAGDPGRRGRRTGGRIRRLWLAGLALPAVAGLGLVGGAVPAAAAVADASAGNGRPILTLEDQSAWVTSPSAGVPGTFTLTVGLSRALAARGGLDLDVTAYNRLTARSTLEQDFTSAPSGFLDATGALPVPATLTGPAGTDGATTASVAVATNGDETAPTGQGLLDLDCAAGTCSGVYPVEVELEHDGNRLTRFTTFLTYVEQVSPNPLEVSVVLPVSAPLRLSPAAGSPADWAVPHLAAAEVRSLRALVTTLAQHPGLPVTIDVDPRTVQALEGAGRPGRAVVHQLAAVSQAGTDQFPAQPYAPVDLAGLAGAHLGSEVSAQRQAGQAVLTAAHLRVHRGSWVSDDRPGSELAAGLARLGADQVVVPADGLSQATEQIDGDAVTWSEPFLLDLGHGKAVSAAVADGGLGPLFDADPGDPVLAANQLLADLAFIHFEVPGAKARGVVVDAPPNWSPDAAFVGALLGGLGGNPVLSPGTLDHFFADVPVGNHGSPRVRHPISSGPGPSLAPGLGPRLAAARARLRGFTGAERGGGQVVAGLAKLLLNAESETLGAAAQTAEVAEFERALSGQLDLFTLSTDGTLTLTARTARIPVTIFSNASYTLEADLQLSSDKFEFPHGAVRNDVVLNRATTVVPVQVEARTIGDLPLTVTLRTATGDLIIARDRITVRSTATSLVGIILTLAAAAVLLVWWARTWRSGRAAKRRARDQPA